MGLECSTRQHKLTGGGSRTRQPTTWTRQPTRQGRDANKTRQLGPGSQQDKAWTDYRTRGRVRQIVWEAARLHCPCCPGCRACLHGSPPQPEYAYFEASSPPGPSPPRPPRHAPKNGNEIMQAIPWPGGRASVFKLSPPEPKIFRVQPRNRWRRGT